MNPATITALAQITAHTANFLLEYSAGKKTPGEIDAYKMRMQAALYASGISLDETISRHPNAPEGD